MSVNGVGGPKTPNQTSYVDDLDGMPPPPPPEPPKTKPRVDVSTIDAAPLDSEIAAAASKQKSQAPKPEQAFVANAEKLLGGASSDGVRLYEAFLQLTAQQQKNCLSTLEPAELAAAMMLGNKADALTRAQEVLRLCSPSTPFSDVGAAYEALISRKPDADPDMVALRLNEARAWRAVADTQPIALAALGMVDECLTHSLAGVNALKKEAQGIEAPGSSSEAVAGVGTVSEGLSDLAQKIEAEQAEIAKLAQGAPLPTAGKAYELLPVSTEDKALLDQIAKLKTLTPKQCDALSKLVTQSKNLPSVIQNYGLLGTLPSLADLALTMPKRKTRDNVLALIDAADGDRPRPLAISQPTLEEAKLAAMANPLAAQTLTELAKGDKAKNTTGCYARSLALQGITPDDIVLYLANGAPVPRADGSNPIQAAIDQAGPPPKGNGNFVALNAVVQLLSLQKEAYTARATALDAQIETLRSLPFSDDRNAQLAAASTERGTLVSAGAQIDRELRTTKTVALKSQVTSQQQRIAKDEAIMVKHDPASAEYKKAKKDAEVARLSLQATGQHFSGLSKGGAVGGFIETWGAKAYMADASAGLMLDDAGGDLVVPPADGKPGSVGWALQQARTVNPKLDGAVKDVRASAETSIALATSGKPPTLSELKLAGEQLTFDPQTTAMTKEWLSLETNLHDARRKKMADEKTKKPEAWPAIAPDYYAEGQNALVSSVGAMTLIAPTLLDASAANDPSALKQDVAARGELAQLSGVAAEVFAERVSVKVEKDRALETFNASNDSLLNAQLTVAQKTKELREMAKTLERLTDPSTGQAVWDWIDDRDVTSYLPISLVHDGILYVKAGDGSDKTIPMTREQYAEALKGALAMKSEDLESYKNRNDVSELLSQGNKAANAANVADSEKALLDEGVPPGGAGSDLAGAMGFLSIAKQAYADAPVWEKASDPYKVSKTTFYASSAASLDAELSSAAGFIARQETGDALGIPSLEKQLEAAQAEGKAAKSPAEQAAAGEKLKTLSIQLAAAKKEAHAAELKARSELGTEASADLKTAETTRQSLEDEKVKKSLAPFTITMISGLAPSIAISAPGEAADCLLLGEGALSDVDPKAKTKDGQPAKLALQGMLGMGATQADRMSAVFYEPIPGATNGVGTSSSTFWQIAGRAEDAITLAGADPTGGKLGTIIEQHEEAKATAKKELAERIVVLQKRKEQALQSYDAALGGYDQKVDDQGWVVSAVTYKDEQDRFARIGFVDSKQELSDAYDAQIAELQGMAALYDSALEIDDIPALFKLSTIGEADFPTVTNPGVTAFLLGGGQNAPGMSLLTVSESLPDTPKSLEAFLLPIEEMEGSIGSRRTVDYMMLGFSQDSYTLASVTDAIGITGWKLGDDYGIAGSVINGAADFLDSPHTVDFLVETALIEVMTFGLGQFLTGFRGAALAGEVALEGTAALEATAGFARFGGKAATLLGRAAQPLAKGMMTWERTMGLPTRVLAQMGMDGVAGRFVGGLITQIAVQKATVYTTELATEAFGADSVWTKAVSLAGNFVAVGTHDKIAGLGSLSERIGFNLSVMGAQEALGAGIKGGTKHYLEELHKGDPLWTEQRIDEVAEQYSHTISSYLGMAFFSMHGAWGAKAGIEQMEQQRKQKVEALTKELGLTGADAAQLQKTITDYDRASAEPQLKADAQKSLETAEKALRALSKNDKAIDAFIGERKAELTLKYLPSAGGYAAAKTPEAVKAKFEARSKEVKQRLMQEAGMSDAAAAKEAETFCKRELVSVATMKLGELPEKIWKSPDLKAQLAERQTQLKDTLIAFGMSESEAKLFASSAIATEIEAQKNPKLKDLLLEQRQQAEAYRALEVATRHPEEVVLMDAETETAWTLRETEADGDMVFTRDGAEKTLTQAEVEAKLETHEIGLIAIEPSDIVQALEQLPTPDAPPALASGKTLTEVLNGFSIDLRPGSNEGTALSDPFLVNSVKHEATPKREAWIEEAYGVVITKDGVAEVYVATSIDGPYLRAKDNLPLDAKTSADVTTRNKAMAEERQAAIDAGAWQLAPTPGSPFYLVRPDGTRSGVFPDQTMDAASVLIAEASCDPAKAAKKASDAAHEVRVPPTVEPVLQKTLDSRTSDPGFVKMMLEVSPDRRMDIVSEHLIETYVFEAKIALMKDPTARKEMAAVFAKEPVTNAAIAKVFQEAAKRAGIGIEPKMLDQLAGDTLKKVRAMERGYSVPGENKLSVVKEKESDATPSLSLALVQKLKDKGITVTQDDFAGVMAALTSKGTPAEREAKARVELKKLLEAKGASDVYASLDATFKSRGLIGKDEMAAAALSELLGYCDDHAQLTKAPLAALDAATIAFTDSIASVPKIGTKQSAIPATSKPREVKGKFDVESTQGEHGKLYLTITDSGDTYRLESAGVGITGYGGKNNSEALYGVVFAFREPSGAVDFIYTNTHEVLKRLPRAVDGMMILQGEKPQWVSAPEPPKIDPATSEPIFDLVDANGVVIETVSIAWLTQNAPAAVAEMIKPESSGIERRFERPPPSDQQPKGYAPIDPPQRVAHGVVRENQVGAEKQTLWRVGESKDHATGLFWDPANRKYLELPLKDAKGNDNFYADVLGVSRVGGMRENVDAAFAEAEAMLKGEGRTKDLERLDTLIRDADGEEQTLIFRAFAARGDVADVEYVLTFARDNGLSSRELLGMLSVEGLIQLFGNTCAPTVAEQMAIAADPRYALDVYRGQTKLWSEKQREAMNALSPKQNVGDRDNVEPRLIPAENKAGIDKDIIGNTKDATGGTGPADYAAMVTNAIGRRLVPPKTFVAVTGRSSDIGAFLLQLSTGKSAPLEGIALLATMAGGGSHAIHILGGEPRTVTRDGVTEEIIVLAVRNSWNGEVLELELGAGGLYVFTGDRAPTASEAYLSIDGMIVDSSTPLPAGITIDARDSASPTAPLAKGPIAAPVALTEPLPNRATKQNAEPIAEGDFAEDVAALAAFDGVTGGKKAFADFKRAMEGLPPALSDKLTSALVDVCDAYGGLRGAQKRYLEYMMGSTLSSLAEPALSARAQEYTDALHTLAQMAPMPGNIRWHVAALRSLDQPSRAALATLPLEMQQEALLILASMAESGVKKAQLAPIAKRLIQSLNPDGLAAVKASGNADPTSTYFRFATKDAVANSKPTVDLTGRVGAAIDNTQYLADLPKAQTKEHARDIARLADEVFGLGDVPTLLKEIIGDPAAASTVRSGDLMTFGFLISTLSSAEITSLKSTLARLSPERQALFVLELCNEYVGPGVKARPEYKNASASAEALAKAADPIAARKTWANAPAFVGAPLEKGDFPELVTGKKLFGDVGAPALARAEAFFSFAEKQPPSARKPNANERAMIADVATAGLWLSREYAGSMEGATPGAIQLKVESLAREYMTEQLRKQGVPEKDIPALAKDFAESFGGEIAKKLCYDLGMESLSDGATGWARKYEGSVVGAFKAGTDWNAAAFADGGDTMAAVRTLAEQMADNASLIGDERADYVDAFMREAKAQIGGAILEVGKSEAITVPELPGVTFIVPFGSSRAQVDLMKAEAIGMIESLGLTKEQVAEVFHARPLVVNVHAEGSRTVDRAVGQPLDSFGVYYVVDRGALYQRSQINASIEGMGDIFSSNRNFAHEFAHGLEFAGLVDFAPWFDDFVTTQAKERAAETGESIEVATNEVVKLLAPSTYGETAASEFFAELAVDWRGYEAKDGDHPRLKNRINTLSQKRAASSDPAEIAKIDAELRLLEPLRDKMTELMGQPKDKPPAPDSIRMDENGQPFELGDVGKQGRKKGEVAKGAPAMDENGGVVSLQEDLNGPVKPPPLLSDPSIKVNISQRGPSLDVIPKKVKVRADERIAKEPSLRALRKQCEDKGAVYLGFIDRLLAVGESKQTIETLVNEALTLTPEQLNARGPHTQDYDMTCAPSCIQYVLAMMHPGYANLLRNEAAARAGQQIRMLEAGGGVANLSLLSDARADIMEDALSSEVRAAFAEQGVDADNYSTEAVSPADAPLAIYNSVLEGVKDKSSALITRRKPDGKVEVLEIIGVKDGDLVLKTKASLIGRLFGQTKTELIPLDRFGVGPDRTLTLDGEEVLSVSASMNHPLIVKPQGTDILASPWAQHDLLVGVGAYYREVPVDKVSLGDALTTAGQIANDGEPVLMGVKRESGGSHLMTIVGGGVDKISGQPMVLVFDPDPNAGGKPKWLPVKVFVEGKYSPFMQEGAMEPPAGAKLAKVNRFGVPCDAFLPPKTTEEGTQADLAIRETLKANRALAEALGLPVKADGSWDTQSKKLNPNNLAFFLEAQSIGKGELALSVIAEGKAKIDPLLAKWVLSGPVDDVPPPGDNLVLRALWQTAPTPELRAVLEYVANLKPMQKRLDQLRMEIDPERLSYVADEFARSEADGLKALDQLKDPRPTRAASAKNAVPTAVKKTSGEGGEGRVSIVHPGKANWPPYTSLPEIATKANVIELLKELKAERVRLGDKQGELRDWLDRKIATATAAGDTALAKSLTEKRAKLDIPRPSKGSTKTLVRTIETPADVYRAFAEQMLAKQKEGSSACDKWRKIVDDANKRATPDQLIRTELETLQAGDLKRVEEEILGLEVALQLQEKGNKIVRYEDVFTNPNTGKSISDIDLMTDAGIMFELSHGDGGGKTTQISLHFTPGQGDLNPENRPVIAVITEASPGRLIEIECSDKSKPPKLYVVTSVPEAVSTHEALRYREAQAKAGKTVEPSDPQFLLARRDDVDGASLKRALSPTFTAAEATPEGIFRKYAASFLEAGPAGDNQSEFAWVVLRMDEVGLTKELAAALKATDKPQELIKQLSKCWTLGEAKALVKPENTSDDLWGP